MPENTSVINNFGLCWKGTGRFAFPVVRRGSGNGQSVVPILLTNEGDELRDLGFYSYGYLQSASSWSLAVHSCITRLKSFFILLEIPDICQVTRGIL